MDAETEDLTEQICFDRVVRQRDEARARIETLEAENELLRIALVPFLNGGIPLAELTRAEYRMVQTARAALKEY